MLSIRRKNIFVLAQAAAALFFASAIVVYASWADPTSLPNQTSVSGLINTSSVQNYKKGGLQVNAACAPPGGCPTSQTQPTQIGLIVDGNPSLGTGKVGIGTQTPSEQLEVVGNMIVNGYLYLQNGASSNFPDKNELLTWVEPIGQTPTVDWVSDLGWITIQRTDIYDVNAADPGKSRGCLTVFPDCPQDWTEYAEILSGASCSATAGTPFVVVNDYRTCEQNFFVAQSQQLPD